MGLGYYGHITTAGLGHRRGQKLLGFGLPRTKITLVRATVGKILSGFGLLWTQNPPRVGLPRAKIALAWAILGFGPPWANFSWGWAIMGTEPPRVRATVTARLVEPVKQRVAGRGEGSANPRSCSNVRNAKKKRHSAAQSGTKSAPRLLIILHVRLLNFDLHFEHHFLTNVIPH